MRSDLGAIGIVFGVFGAILLSIGQPVGVLMLPLAISFLAAA